MTLRVRFDSFSLDGCSFRQTTGNMRRRRISCSIKPLLLACYDLETRDDRDASWPGRVDHAQGFKAAIAYYKRATVVLNKSNDM